MNVLILAAGPNPAETGSSTYPIWLSEVDGELILQRQMNALAKAGSCRFILLFRQDDADAFFLRDIAEQLDPTAVVIGVRGTTAGAACSALLAAGELDMDAELIVASATDQIDIDIGSVLSQFRERGADAGVLTFESLHPRYSYVRLNDYGWVVESSEKRPISRTASAGFYWFKRASDFFDGACRMILKDAQVQGNFYICPVLNELVLQHKKIAAIALGPDHYFPVKSEKQANYFEQNFDERSPS